MPVQLHLEGPALEPLLAQARAAHGADVTVVRAQRFRHGGFAGFFAKERFQLTVEVEAPRVPSPHVPAPDVPAPHVPAPQVRAAVAAAQAAGGSAVDTFVPSSRRAPVAAPSAAVSLEDLLAAADSADGLARPAPAADEVGSDRAVAPTPVAPTPVAPTAAPPIAVPAPAGSSGAVPAAAVASGSEGTRRAGRGVSTETREFEDVLAALRADLLGPGSTSALDGGLEPPPSLLLAPARSWLPSHVLEEAAAATEDAGSVPTEPDVIDLAPPAPDVTEPPAADPAAPAPRVDLLPAPDVEPAVEPAAATPAVTPAVTLAVTPDAVVDGPAAVTVTPGPSVPDDLVAGLAGLARLVGVDPARALAAAQDVAASGCREPRRTLPLLAAALGDGLAAQDRLDAGPGALVLVLGAGDHVGATAVAVAAHLGTPWRARWHDGPGPRPDGDPVVADVRRVHELQAGARTAGQPLVLQLDDPSLAPDVSVARAGSARAGLLALLGADLLVLAVDATVPTGRQGPTTQRVALAQGPDRPLVLALRGAGRSGAPAAHAQHPVVLLEDRPAGPGAWAGLLLDALRAAAPS